MSNVKGRSARPNIRRWVVVAVLVVAFGTVMIGVVGVWLGSSTTSGAGQSTSPPFRAENQYQQIAYDSALTMGRRSASDGTSASAYASACRSFAAQAPSSSSDFYGEETAAMSGCIAGLETYYPGE